MAITNNWFDVNKKGLEQLLNGKSRTFAIAELVQNSWDQDVTEVTVEINKDSAGSHNHRVIVTDDDPNGWQDISDAFTLFNPSNKKSDPTKRGRFNLGEKLVLAICKEAKIVSVNSAVKFDAKGRRLIKSRTDSGSYFNGLLKLSKPEVKEFKDYVKTFLAPENIKTVVKIFDDEFVLQSHKKIVEFALQLPTITADVEGNLKRTTRTTTVELFEVKDGEKPTIYEMGIPVVNLDGDKWHINIQQKIPLNMDRDNVTPAYLSQLRVAVLNEAGHLLEDDESTDSWVSSAAADERASSEAVERVLTSRYGEKRVSYDPSDPEANKIAMSRGYTVITGGSLSSGLWKNAKASSAIQPAGQVTPSPKPYSDDPNAKPVTIVPQSDWTEDQTRFVKYAKKLHMDLIGQPLHVRVVKVNNFSAAYGQCRLDINAKNGKAWFATENFQNQISLLLHEFAHFYCGDHFDHKFHGAICDLGAKLALQLGADAQS